MTYTQEVQRLIDDPFAGRTAEDIQALCQGDLAQRALAHQAETEMLAKFARDNEVTVEHSAQLFEETKRFLVLGRLVVEQLAPSADIDDMWHHWILYTKDYHAFCELTGGYIHHKPIPAGSPAQPPLEPTITLMQAAYGTIDERAWPIELGARGIMDCKMGA